MKKQLNCILLVDDDEPTNFLNRMTLEEMACAQTIRVAQSGQEALDFLTNASQVAPDLIFLDINMPAMDGWEFLDRYKKLSNAKKAGTVVIMLTTSLNPDDEIRSRSIPEIAGFGNKPLSPGMIDGLMEKYFDTLS